MKIYRVLKVCNLSLLILATAPRVCFAQFVIDAPPTIVPDFFSLNAGEILNVLDGGQVGSQLRANAGSIVNVAGGTVGPGFHANSGSQVSISSGSVDSFSTQLGSTLSVSGGTLGDGVTIEGAAVFSGGTVGRQFQTSEQSTIQLTGAEFELDGEPYTNQTISINRITNIHSVLTGTLADGSPFIFSPLGDGDELYGVTLTRTSVPAANLNPQEISSNLTGIVSGMRKGQKFIVQAGGVLPRNFSVVEASLSVQGGEVGRNIQIARGIVNVSDGRVGDFFYAYPGSTVNVSGGRIGFRFNAFESIVNITDGQIGSSFQVHSGTTAKISGGRINSILAGSGSSIEISGGAVGFGGNLDSSLQVLSGSEVEISGGTLGRSLRTLSGSDVELIGGEFLLNGTHYPGASISLSDYDVLTGTLSDGSTFIFTPIHGDLLESVTLTRTTLPPVDTAPQVVDSIQTQGPAGLRPGQRLSVQNGGVLLENFAIVGATLEVDGGDAGSGIEVVGGTIDIRGGTVGAGLRVLDANLNMSGGSIGERSAVYRGAVVNITGGNIGTKFSAFTGSQITLAGGAVGPDFRIREGSDVTFVGGEFRLNGDDYLESAITIDDRRGPLQVFSGILSDGSPFIFSPQANPLGDELRNVQLVRSDLPAVDLTPQLVDAPLASEINGLRRGQTMSVVDGGELPENFTAIGATLNILGGKVGSFAEVLDSRVSISGGEVGGWFQAHNSVVEVTGGDVGVQFAAFSGTTATIDDAAVRGISVYENAYVELTGDSEVEFSVQAWSGSEIRVNNAKIGGSIQAINGLVTFEEGKVSGSFIATSASDVVVAGGSVNGFVPISNDSNFRFFGGDHAARLNVSSRSTLEIFGGRFSGSLTHRDGTVNVSGGDFSSLTSISVSDNFNIVGTEFYLDGVLIDLALGIPTEITERNIPLSGILADGSPFEFTLNDIPIIEQDYFDANATLTVTLIPEPTSAILLLAACGLLLFRRKI